jgi:cytoskeleton-associated protein 5
MKPALKQLLEAEFTKVGFDPAATKKSKNVKEGGSNDSNGIPRCDITSILDKNIINELNCTDGKTSWQNRKIALESIIASCENSGYFIEANKGTSEILKGVKNRITDTQANLKPIAVTAIGKIIASLSPESGCKYLRVVSCDLIGGLADNKNSMRIATTAALQMAVTLNAPPGEGANAPVANVSLLNILLAPLGEALTTTPIGRLEILTWLLLHVETIQIDCNDLTSPLVVAMQDKTAIVRGLAEQFLGNLVSKELISRDQLDKATRSLAPAALRTLQAPIEKMIHKFNAKTLTTELSSLTIVPEVSTEETPSVVSNIVKPTVRFYFILLNLIINF